MFICIKRTLALFCLTFWHSIFYGCILLLLHRYPYALWVGCLKWVFSMFVYPSHHLVAHIILCLSRLHLSYRSSPHHRFPPYSLSLLSYLLTIMIRVQYLKFASSFYVLCVSYILPIMDMNRRQTSASTPSAWVTSVTRQWISRIQYVFTKPRFSLAENVQK